MAFDAYHKWLGIPPEQQPPHYYQLLGISVNEEDPEVIETAAQRQRAIVEENLHGSHRKAANQLIFEIDEAELTLSSPELREEYNRQVKLTLRKQKRKQSVSNLNPDSNQPAGESSGLITGVVGIVSVLLVGFLIMAYFGYQKPRSEEEKKILRAKPINVEKQSPSLKPPSENAESSSPPSVVLATTQAEAMNWILSVNGRMTTRTGQQIERAEDLPSGPSEITTINLNNCDITDEMLPNILPLTSVQSLMLNDTKITGKSMEVINQLKNLVHLYVAGSKLKGPGLAKLSTDLKLRSLYLSNLQLNDQEIKPALNFPQLENFATSENQVTVQTLKALTQLKNLVNIHIYLTDIRDEDLSLLQDFPKLRSLYVGSPQLSETGLMAELSRLNELTALWIFEVTVTDLGTNTLANMTNLKQIRLIRTNISDANLARLKQALPNTKFTVTN